VWWVEERMMAERDPLRILVVDDEPDLCNVIRYNLNRRGHVAAVADSGEAALALLGQDPVPDLVVSDVMMPGMDGFELCRRLRATERTAQIPVVFLTARSAPADRQEGFRVGCDDYLAKPFDMDELLVRVEALGRRLGWARRAAERVAVAAAGPDARAPVRAPPVVGPTEVMQKLAQYEQRFPALRTVRRDIILGSSSSMANLFEEVLIQSHTRDPVLIFGETGTGKTVVAEALWRLGPRADKPFRTVSCAELQAADPLIVMGRLFGFGRNSGLLNVPKEGQPGMLEECHGGTLFLDEVALLPAQAQALLLLPAEGRPFNPAAGRGEPVQVDVKLLFATNRDLVAETAAGRFPLDLMMRMGHALIRLPSLRERPEDARELCRHFVAEVAVELGQPGLEPSTALLEEIERRPWPGNVRELRSAVRDAARRASFHGAAEVGRDHLPPPSSLLVPGEVAANVPGMPPAPTEGRGRPVPQVAAAPSPPLPPNPGGVEFSTQELLELVVLRRHRFHMAPAETELGLSQKSRTLTNHLRGFCFKALHRTGFDVAKSAVAVAGGPEEMLVERLTGRIQQYLATVRDNVAAGTPEKLFNNLPRDYHHAVEEAMARARDGTLPVVTARSPGTYDGEEDPV
jgi:DNA-binding NtrC family response regulator